MIRITVSNTLKMKPTVVKYVWKLLKTMKVMLILAYPMLIQKPPTNILGILLATDQYQTTYLMDNESKMQLVEMETKTIGPRKL